jgi:hypothetical protein
MTMSKKRPLGKGRVIMPWYWRVSLSSSSEECEDLEMDWASVHAKEAASKVIC